MSPVGKKEKSMFKVICRNKITGLSDGRGELLFALVSIYLVKSFMQIT